MFQGIKLTPSNLRRIYCLMSTDLQKTEFLYALLKAQPGQTQYWVNAKDEFIGTGSMISYEAMTEKYSQETLGEAITSNDWFDLKYK